MLGGGGGWPGVARVTRGRGSPRPRSSMDHKIHLITMETEASEVHTETAGDRVGGGSRTLLSMMAATPAMGLNTNYSVTT